MPNPSTSSNQSLPKSGMTAEFLKIFAALTMLIDHLAIAVVYKRLLSFVDCESYLEILKSGGEVSAEVLASVPEHFTKLYTYYSAMRMVGRIAFPIFCFLIYEGFTHTKDLKRYLLRLAIVALAAEIPFNMICSIQFEGKICFFYPQHQNTVFALLLSLLMLTVLKKLENDEITIQSNIKKMLLQYVAVAAACVIAVLCRMDYAYIGPLFIAVLYFCRQNKTTRLILGALVFLISTRDIATLLAFVPIAMYNGYRFGSKKLKYFFYIFYPAHLLVLGIIALFL